MAGEFDWGTNAEDELRKGLIKGVLHPCTKRDGIAMITPGGNPMCDTCGRPHLTLGERPKKEMEE